MTLAFTPRRFESIIAEMIATAATITDRATDFNTGAVMRSILEAAAIQVERSEVGFSVGVQRGIEESAYTLWRYARQPAVRSYGLLRLTANTPPVSDILIPQGCRFGVPGTQLYYVTEQNYIFPALASTYDIVVACHTAGTIGNVAANTITQILSSLTGIDSCTNPEALFTGQDEETDQDRRTRFAEYIRSIHRGTKSALELGARQAQVLDTSGYVTEQVVSAQAVEGTGNADIYLWNGVSGASSSLIAECQTILYGRALSTGERIPGFKAAGITLTVQAATQVATAVTIEVALDEGFVLADIRPACVARVEEVFAGLDIGDTLYLSALACAVRRVPGVLDAEVTIPTDAVESDEGEIIVLSGTPVIQEPPSPT